MAGRASPVPSPDQVVRLVLGSAESARFPGRAMEATARLLAQECSLDEFLLDCSALGVAADSATRIAAGCAALPTPGAAAGGPMAHARPGGTLRIALWTAPEGLDPALSTTRTSRLLTEQLYQTVTALDADARPYPDLSLVESIEVAEDARAYTFTLREGLRFHDGSAVGAEDLAFSLDRIADPATHYHFEPWTETMAGTEVVDGRRVRLRLSRPTGPILTWLAFSGAGIVPRAAVGAGRDLTTAPLGSGPFRLAGGSVGPDGLAGRLRLERHVGASAGHGPFLDALEFMTIPDDAERADALLAGRVDLDALVGFGEWRRISAAPGVTATATQDGRWHWMFANCRDPLLGEPRVRRAISLALDRQALVDEGLAGLGSPITDGPIAPWSWASAPDLGSWPERGDPEGARALLAAAGVASGTLLEMTALETLPLAMRQAELIAAQLGRVGLDVRIRRVTAAEWVARIRPGGAFQLGTSYWGSPVNDPDDFLWMNHHSGARYDAGGCGSGPLDDLLQAGRDAIRQVERRDLYRRAQGEAAALLPVIPLVQAHLLRGFTDRLRGFVPLRNAQLRTLRLAWLAGT